MNVKELIKALQELPQDADVYYLTNDGGMTNVSKVKKAFPGGEEEKDIVGEVFVLIE